MGAQAKTLREGILQFIEDATWEGWIVSIRATVLNSHFRVFSLVRFAFFRQLT